MNNVPDDEINKMTYENAMRWYSFDPFTHIRREQATVGALRKAAEGHDVSIRSSRPPHGHRAGSSFADFAANAKALTGNTGLNRHWCRSNAESPFEGGDHAILRLLALKGDPLCPAME